MKVRFIGGTGNISTSVSVACLKRGIELYLLTRGTRHVDIPGAGVRIMFAILQSGIPRIAEI